MYLTPHINFSNDEVAIIDCLVDNERMPKDFSRNQVISFLSGEDFYLILYFSVENDRGFHQYLVEDFSDNEEEMYQLSASLEQQIREGINPEMMYNAKYLVDSQIKMIATFRALFHKEDFSMEY